MSIDRVDSTLQIRSGGTLDVDGTLDLSDATEAIGTLVLRTHTQTIDYTALGSGASVDVAITGLPNNAHVLGANLEVDTPAAGEGDLQGQIGYTADPDGLMTAQNLDAVAADSILGGAGALAGFEWRADATTDGLGVRFTATELGDVTAGAWTAHIIYVQPVVASTT